MIALDVSDDGDGISPEDVLHLFERFYRADVLAFPGIGRLGTGPVDRAATDRASPRHDHRGERAGQGDHLPHPASALAGRGLDDDLDDDLGGDLDDDLTATSTVIRMATSTVIRMATSPRITEVRTSTRPLSQTPQIPGRPPQTSLVKTQRTLRHRLRLVLPILNAGVSFRTEALDTGAFGAGDKQLGRTAVTPTPGGVESPARVPRRTQPGPASPRSRTRL